MYVLDEEFFLDLEKSGIAHHFLDPEEEEAYARLVMKGKVKKYGKNY